MTPPICTVMQYDHTLVPPPPTSGYSTYSYSALYGQGTGSIFLYGLSCYGTESSLYYCSYYGSVVTTYCSHSQDASVTCYGATSTPTSMCTWRSVWGGHRGGGGGGGGVYGYDYPTSHTYMCMYMYTYVIVIIAPYAFK